MEVDDLKRFEDRNLRYLSGGQKQRLVIASALVTKPRVLVLDEPTYQLDPVGTREVLDTLRRLNREPFLDRFIGCLETVFSRHFLFTKGVIFFFTIYIGGIISNRQ